MHPEGNPLKGVALVVLAVLLFAMADTLGKHLAMLYPVTMVLAVRYTVNLGLVSLTMLPRHGTALWRTHRTGLVILRGFCLALGSVSMLMAMQVMPLAETVAIIYITPLLVMIAGAVFLHETVSRMGWVAAVLGFAGVLLIVRPGSGLDGLGVALSLFNAACATGYHLLTRFLTRTETTMALVFHTALVGTVSFVVLMLVLRTETLPSTFDFVTMLALGTLATAGHLIFTLAYREAPASTLAPVNYMHIAFATLLGWLVFQQLPDALGFTGMALIAAAGLLAAWWASR
jgi:drug/metabolite transporter (DMT)-like permease